MSVDVFAAEQHGGGHDFPQIDRGHDFSLRGGVTLSEAKGGGEGTWKKRRRTYVTDSCSNDESVSVTTPTAMVDLLSNKIESVTDEYLFNSSISSPPTDSIHVEEGNNDWDWGDYGFSGLVFDTDDLERLGVDTTRAPRHGFPLVEVFSVVIEKKPPAGHHEGGVSSSSSSSSSSLYGTIFVDDELSHEYIYNTKREDSESIISLPGDDGGNKTALLLTGLSEALYACSTFRIDVILKDRNLSPDDDDDVFCCGTIYWDIPYGFAEKHEDGKVSSVIYYEPVNKMFDKPLAAKFNCKSGSVTLYYAMWFNGVRATVEVTLLKGDADGANVYGLIRAGNTCGNTTCWSVLFQKKKKKSDDSIYVRPGQLIPLSKSIVAVNKMASLQVSVELYNHCRDRHLSQHDDEIAKGTVDFLPQTKCISSEKNISGRYGEIRVKVTWRPC